MARKFVCSQDEPVVQTRAGRLRGFILDGVYTFHGIKYADARRFQMPTPVQPWEGIADATNYGYICPVEAEPAPKGEVLIPHRFWPANEHCQYLNIWTTSLDSQAKKPVMVWLHGGGYSNGSSIEQVAYEGDALAQSGDVVVVTLNHRLNILGYLDMSSFGEKYYNSVNAGMADIVEALRWVRDNIQGFGGDPDNVTVFGQSGGGGKVQTLLQTPAAEGLFHRAVLMSGIWEAGGRTVENHHRELVEGMLRELNIPLNEVERLEHVPYAFLIRAYKKASLALLKQGKMISWGPQANDWYLGDPMVVGFTDFAKTVPTMAGTVIAEFSFAPNVSGDGLTEAEKCALVKEKYGENAEKVIELFRAAYPEKDLTRALSLDVVTRLATTKFIEKKAQVSSAPAYLYVFALDFDVSGGKPAWHCSDIPFVFHNTYRVPCANIEGVTERLEAEVSGAWVNFARSGNPNGGAVPAWPGYDDDSKTTMVFDRQSGARSNYDRSLVELLRTVTSSPFDSKDRIARMIAQAESEDEGGAWMY